MINNFHRPHDLLLWNLMAHNEVDTEHNITTSQIWVSFWSVLYLFFVTTSQIYEANNKSKEGYKFRLYNYFHPSSM